MAIRSRLHVAKQRRTGNGQIARARAVHRAGAAFHRAARRQRARARAFLIAPARRFIARRAHARAHGAAGNEHPRARFSSRRRGVSSRGAMAASTRACAFFIAPARRFIARRAHAGAHGASGNEHPQRAFSSRGARGQSRRAHDHARGRALRGTRARARQQHEANNSEYHKRLRTQRTKRWYTDCCQRRHSHATSTGTATRASACHFFSRGL